MQNRSLVASLSIRRFLLIVILSTGYCFPSMAFANVPHWQTSRYIAKSFAEIALSSIYRSGTKRIIKWEKGINYYFDHRYPDRTVNEQLAGLHLQHLTSITGVKMKHTKRRSNANLVIIFSKEKNMVRDFTHAVGLKSIPSVRKLIRKNVCLAYTSYSSSGKIHRAIVLVAIDKAREAAGLVSCIVEELSEIMGLPNDSKKVYPSIFNDYSTEDLLTGLDYLMLKILYDKRIKAGMTRRQLMPVLNKIIAELRQSNIIRTAEREVKKGGLYALMYDT